MTPVSAASTRAPDHLWWALQRVPAARALRAAAEARLREAAGLPTPLLTLDDDHPYWRIGRLDPTADLDGPDIPPAALWISVEPPRFGALIKSLQEIAHFLQPGGRLALCAPRPPQIDNGEASDLQLALNEAGFHVEQWQPLHSAATQAAEQRELNPYADWLYAATGHYVLNPTPTALAERERRLRPHFDAEPLMPEDGVRVFYLATLIAHEPIIQEPLPPRSFLAPAPPSVPLDAPTATAEPTAPTAAPVVAPPPSATAERPPERRAAPWIAAALVVATLAAALRTQLVLQDDPTRPQNALLWWLAALFGLLAVGRLARQRSADDWGLTLGRPRIDPTTASRAGLWAAGLGLAALAYTQGARPLIGLPLWLLGSILAWRALGGLEPGHWQASRAAAPPRAHLLAMAGVTAGALLIRFWQVGRHPFMLNGIEAQLGLEAQRVTELFSSAWLTHPTLPLFINRIGQALLGPTPLALRLLSPLVGAVTVWAAYAIGRRMWSAPVGVLAALLIAGNHVHIHYSRLGMTNVWDALLILLALGGAAAAWQTDRRLTWLGAGAAIGLSAYFFTAAHLLPLMLVVLIGATALLQGDNLRHRSRHIAAAALLALVVGLPQLLYYNGNREVFMDRANALGVLRNGWLAQEAAVTGRSQTAILGDQFWQATLAFNATRDRDAVYNPGRPFFGSLVGLFFLSGVGMALFHIRDTRYAALLIGLLTTVIFGGALLLDPPASRRLMVVLPLACLLAARAIVWLCEKSAVLWRGGQASSADLRRVVWPVVVAIGLSVAVADLSFYFGAYRQANLTAPRFGDRNTEIAYRIGNWLATRPAEDGTTVYFYGEPIMYADAPTIAFLAPQYRRGVNLFDVADPASLPTQPGGPAVHIYLAERASDLLITQAQWPTGELLRVGGAFGDPLFLIYRVDAAP